MNFFTPRSNVVACLLFSWLAQLHAMPGAPTYPAATTAPAVAPTPGQSGVQVQGQAALPGIPVVAEQLTWPTTIELSEQNKGMVSNPAVAQYYTKAIQTCKTMETGLKTLEQTINSIETTTNQKLETSSATTQLINVDIGKLQELFNPKEKN